MNRQSDLYSFLYAAIMVIIVAGVLASVSLGLKDKQNTNIAIEKMQNILAAVNIESSAKNAEEVYKKYVKSTLVITPGGEEVTGEDAFSINVKKESAKLRKAFDLKEKGNDGESEKVLRDVHLPIFVSETEEGKKYIIPVYGKGMWDDIWGYVSFDDDKKTIYGAAFDHVAETPGLGAEIKEDWFAAQFFGKKIFDESGVFTSVALVKGGADADDEHGVDAVSGGTVTSVKLSNTLEVSLGAYQNYLKK